MPGVFLGHVDLPNVGKTALYALPPPGFYTIGDAQIGRFSCKEPNLKEVDKPVPAAQPVTPSDRNKLSDPTGVIGSEDPLTITAPMVEWAMLMDVLNGLGDGMGNLRPFHRHLAVRLQGCYPLWGNVMRRL